ncbi:MAG: hypothetical protein IT371_21310 [Deltaproteobacteria bacterium]|nr:hypothetical protein [Deltaproteobacteria bacterium]
MAKAVRGWMGLVALLCGACRSTSSGTDAAGPVDASAERGVRDGGSDGGRDGRADRGVDAFVPFSLLLTVNEIPEAMNGSQVYTNLEGKSVPFRLTVPRAGFTVDVLWKGSQAKGEQLEVVANQPLGTGAGQLPAGANLASRFERTAAGHRLRVTPELAAPVGSVTFTARLLDGESPRESALTVDVAERTFLLDPFRLEDTWLVVFSRDLFTVKRQKDAAGNPVVTSVPGANGTPDFEEDLRAAGLGTETMLPACAAAKGRGATGTNAILVRWMRQEIVRGVRKAYLLNADGTATVDSVRLRVLEEGEAGAPELARFSHQRLAGGESAKNFSAISVGGGDPIKPLLGRSKTIDVNNLQNEDNLSPDYGVFTSSALALMTRVAAVDASARQLLQMFLGDFVPELGAGGKPIGEHALDAEILADGFDPAKGTPGAAARYQKLALVVQILGRLVGALTAHEMGHALGLVPSGAPPYGLFGGERNAAFVNPARTTLGHIDTPGFNIMEAGPGSAGGASINFADYLSEPRFNELNRAYLQGRLLLLRR